MDCCGAIRGISFCKNDMQDIMMQEIVMLER